MIPLGQAPHANMVMQKGCDLLDTLDLQWWLSAGTVLGIYRDGRLIPHDTDIDVAALDALGMFPEVVSLFEGNGFRLIRPASHQRAFVYLGVIFDFYTFVSDGDNVTAKVDEYTQVKPLRLFKNLGEIEFEGRKYPVPNPVEEYLEVRYGPDWRTPKTHKEPWINDTFCVQ